MAWLCFSFILSFSFLFNPVLSLRSEPRPAALKIPVPESTLSINADAALPSPDTTYYFDQLIDHNDPSLGTFQQRYWHTWEFYQPGECWVSASDQARSNLHMQAVQLS